MIRTRWFDRSEAVRRLANGSVVPVQMNSAVPRQAYRAQHAHTENEAIVYSVLEKNARMLPGGLGHICSLSLPQIAAETRKHSLSQQAMPLGTVRDQLAKLREKHSIIAWDAVASKDTARTPHDGKGITCYRLPLYGDVLKARAADPNIGKTGTKFWIIGKERRFLTPAELVSWKIDELVAAKLGVRAAALGASPEELQPETAPPLRVDAPAADTSPPGAAVSPPQITDVSPVVWKAAQNNTSNPMRKGRVLFYERKCHEIAGAAGESLSAEEIAAIIVQTRTAYHVKRLDIFEGFIGKEEKVVEEQVHAYLEHRAEWRKEEAAAAAGTNVVDARAAWEHQVNEEIERRIAAMGEEFRERAKRKVPEARHALGAQAGRMTPEQILTQAEAMVARQIRDEVEKAIAEDREKHVRESRDLRDKAVG